MQWPASLLLLACLCGQAVGQQLLASGRIAGRYDPVTGLATLPLVIDWPSTTIWAAFDSSDSIDVRIDMQPGDDSAVNCSLAFDLDGQTDVVYVTSDMLPYTWSKSGLSGGSHALQISKRSETLYGILLLTSMTVSSSGRWAVLKLRVHRLGYEQRPSNLCVRLFAVLVVFTNFLVPVALGPAGSSYDSSLSGLNSHDIDSDQYAAAAVDPFE